MGPSTPSSPTPARHRPSSSAGSPRTMQRSKAARPRSSACCKACRRAPLLWKGPLMANHDDLYLISLFGLSAEEATGLGLGPSGQPPRAGGLPAHAERSPAARPAAQQHPTGAHAEPVPPAGAAGFVAYAPEGSQAAAHAPEAERSYRPQADRDADRARRESELALLAMFESADTTRTPDYSGH